MRLFPKTRLNSEKVVELANGYPSRERAESQSKAYFLRASGLLPAILDSGLMFKGEVVT